MKLLRILSLIFLLSIVVTPKAEALLDIFTVYGKRSNSINNIILEALITPDKEWVRSRVPIPEEIETACTYTPKGIDKKDPSTAFYFSELNLKNHTTLHTLGDLYNNQFKNDLHVTTTTLSKDSNSISFENYNMSERTALKEHNIEWIVDLGNGKFRRYKYHTKYENLKDHEKTFWLQLFHYMEEQIKNVSS